MVFVFHRDVICTKLLTFKIYLSHSFKTSKKEVKRVAMMIIFRAFSSTLIFLFPFDLLSLTVPCYLSINGVGREMYNFDTKVILHHNGRNEWFAP